MYLVKNKVSVVDESGISTNKMKMSRRPTILTNLSILDVNHNSNFLGVDENGRCSFIFGAIKNKQLKRQLIYFNAKFYKAAKFGSHYFIKNYVRLLFPRRHSKSKL